MEKEYSYFAAGPTKIPNEVMEEAQKEFVQFEDTHVSVMELSHRSKDFDKIIKEAEMLVKELLNVPPNYKVLFLQGGGTGQFAAVPLNLISRTGKADYVVTGTWSSKAAKECEKYGAVNVVTPPRGPKGAFAQVAGEEQWSQLSPDAAYVYYCDNETVEGIEFDSLPKVAKDIPIVCDMSSNICSRPFDVSKFGLVYAGAQKNIGCAGVTLVIVREDLLGSPLSTCPSVLDYTVMGKAGSLLNTPPTFAIYIINRVLRWVKRNGGVKSMEERAILKSQTLYTCIDKSEGFYHNPVQPSSRSRMNATFRIRGGDEGLETKFLKEAAAEGLLSLKGHRSVGGVRASLYNAVTPHDVTRLTSFMDKFRAANAN